MVWKEIPFRRALQKTSQALREQRKEEDEPPYEVGTETMHGQDGQVQQQELHAPAKSSRPSIDDDNTGMAAPQLTPLELAQMTSTTTTAAKLVDECITAASTSLIVASNVVGGAG